jgi:preprotein translocase subunit SecA
LQNANDIPTLFAIIKQVVKRMYNINYYNCQIFASNVLNEGKIAQMNTGEGKTLTIAISAILNAKNGKVHIVTANEYLVKRDAESLAKLCSFFGIKAGYVLECMSIQEKQMQYQSNIVYATGQQLAFDFLRDNLQHKIANICMPEDSFNSIIIDEIDSVLIDEAVMPLILSTEGTCSSGIKKTIIADNIARKLTDEHFSIQEGDDIVINDKGYDFIEKMAIENGIIKNIDELYSEDFESIRFMNAIYQAIHAHNLKKLDFDYIIHKKAIVIIDQVTGRPAPDRRFQGGLHQAIEAKHNLAIKEDAQKSMVITYKNFLMKYQNIAGISATVDDDIFSELYELAVEKIPTNKPIIRQDKPDILLQTNEERLQAIVGDIMMINKSGQPILIGTTNISDAIILSNELTKHSVQHNLLHANNLFQEAEIIKNAGIFQSFAYKDVFVEYKKRLLNYLDNILFAEDIKNAA